MPSDKSKQYHIAGAMRTMRPLSFFELTDLPEFIEELVNVIPAGGGKPDPVDVLRAMKGRMKAFIAERLGVSVEDLKTVPADTGMEIIADFLEMNASENFMKALVRAVAAGKRIRSQWPSS